MASDWKIVVPEATTNECRNPSAEEPEIVGPELLSNEGFETAGGGDPDFWASWTEVVSDGTLANDQANEHGGDDCALVTAGSTKDTHVYQDVTVVAGKVYRFLVWTYGDGTNSGRYHLYDTDNAADIEALATLGKTAAAWAEADVAFIAPAGCTTVRVYLYCADLDTAAVYFDDVSVKEVNAGELSLDDDVLTRSTTYSKWGLYSWRMQTAADNEGAMYALATLTNAAHYVTMRVRGTLPAAWDWSLDDSTYTAPAVIETLDANWTLYGLAFVAGQANGSTALYVRQSGAGSGDFYIDAIQVEAKSYWTTYADGDQDGCDWNGTDHDSSSDRSAQSRAGGRVQDMEDDYAFTIGNMAGFGNAPASLGIQEYALLPGGEVSGYKVHQGMLTLSGVIVGTSMANLHAVRRVLLEELKPDRYPKDANGWQPVRLRYTAAAVQKEVAVHLDAGLEGLLDATELCYWERVAIRFKMTDPFWYEIGNSSAVLDSGDAVSFHGIGGRLRSTGQWNDLALITNASFRCMVEGPDKKIYVGGEFTGMNPGGADRIGIYDPLADTWSKVGGSNAIPNNNVRSAVFGPDGKLYLGGSFTAVDGDGDSDYVVTWDPATETWAPVGIPDTGAAAINWVSAMAFDSEGNLYVTGKFTNFADVAAADHFAKWDGSAWSALGTPLAGAAAITEAHAIAIDSQDNIYVGGNFLNWADDANADMLVMWDGTAWAAVNSTALNNDVRSIAIDPEDVVYIAGDFTNAASIGAADYVVQWDGLTFAALGLGLAGGVANTAHYANGILYVGGAFTSAGGSATGNKQARWNGSAWAPLDGDLVFTGESRVIYSCNPDPVVGTNRDLYALTTTTGARQVAGLTNITNDGTAEGHPVLKVKRNGGTSATLISTRNETTGKELLFDYALLDGETIIVDLRPKRKEITSDFFGPRPGAILANCDFGTFVLQPDANAITCFVNVVDSPTVTAWAEWRTAYASAD